MAMDELESEGRLYRKTKCGWVDSGSCRVNDAIARRLDKVFYGKESSSASIKELFTRAKQANQMQDYPNAERICLEILKQKACPRKKRRGRSRCCSLHYERSRLLPAHLFK